MWPRPASAQPNSRLGTSPHRGGWARHGKTEAESFVGIDGAKARVDVHVRPDGQAFGGTTDPEGLSALVDRLARLQPRLIVLEASGGDEAVVYSDQPRIACDTVGPGMCDALVALAKEHQGRPMQAAFRGRWCYLTMPRRGDQFRLGSLFRSLDGLGAEAQRVLRDVRIVHRVIDTLHGDRTGRQDEATA